MKKSVASQCIEAVFIAEEKRRNDPTWAKKPSSATLIVKEASYDWFIDFSSPLFNNTTRFIDTAVSQMKF